MELSECKVGDAVWKPAILGTVVERWNGPYPHKVKVKWKPGAPFAKETESWEDPKDLTLVYSEEEAPEVKAPSWNDVEKEDLVEFKFKGEAHSTTVYREGAHTMVMGYIIGSYWVRVNFILTSITKPTPPLPSGAVVIVLKNGDRAHRRARDGRWVPDTILHPLSDEQVQEIGWEVAS